MIVSDTGCYFRHFQEVAVR